MPVLAERAAMAATELEVTAATAVAAATAVTRMAAAHLAAVAATEFCSVLVPTSRKWMSGIAGQRRVVTAARRSAEMVASEDLAALAARGATELEVMAATAVTAVTAVTLMAAPDLAAPAARALG